MSSQHHSYLQLAAVAISFSFGVSALPQLLNGTEITAPITAVTPEPFPYEIVVLTDEITQGFPELDFDDVVYTDSQPIAERGLLGNLFCKLLPSDRSWPVSTVWSLVSFATGQGIIQTVPLAAPCYNGPHYNAAKCADITARWADSDLQYVFTVSSTSRGFGF